MRQIKLNLKLFKHSKKILISNASSSEISYFFNNKLNLVSLNFFFFFLLHANFLTKVQSTPDYLV